MSRKKPWYIMNIRKCEVLSCKYYGTLIQNDCVFIWQRQQAANIHLPQTLRQNLSIDEYDTYICTYVIMCIHVLYSFMCNVHKYVSIYLHKFLSKTTNLSSVDYLEYRYSNLMYYSIDYYGLEFLIHLLHYSYENNHLQIV